MATMLTTFNGYDESAEVKVDSALVRNVVTNFFTVPLNARLTSSIYSTSQCQAGGDAELNQYDEPTITTSRR